MTQPVHFLHSMLNLWKREKIRQIQQQVTEVTRFKTKKNIHTIQDAYTKRTPISRKQPHINLSPSWCICMKPYILNNIVNLSLNQKEPVYYLGFCIANWVSFMFCWAFIGFSFFFFYILQKAFTCMQPTERKLMLVFSVLFFFYIITCTKLPTWSSLLRIMVNLRNRGCAMGRWWTFSTLEVRIRKGSWTHCN